MTMTSAFHARWLHHPLDAYLLHLPRKRNPLRLRLRFDIVILIVIQSRHPRGADRPFASLASLGEVFRCVLVDSLPRLQLVCRSSLVRPQGHIISNLCINKRYGKTVCEDIISNASTIGYMLMPYLFGDHTHILILQRITMALARSGI